MPQEKNPEIKHPAIPYKDPGGPTEVIVTGEYVSWFISPILGDLQPAYILGGSSQLVSD